MIARLVGGAVVLVTAVLAWPSGASAAAVDDGLGLDIRTAQSTYRPGDPVQLTFAVTNASAAACGLTKAAEGSIQISSVRRDGQELSPVLGRSFYLDGIGSAVAAALVTAEPTSTVDVVLAGVRVHDTTDAGSVVLRSVTATPDGGGLDTLWPIGTPGRYEITASYAVAPIDALAPVAANLTPCAGSTPMASATFTVGDVESGFPWWWVLAAVLVALAIAVVVLVLVRRGRHSAAAVAILVGVVSITVTIVGVDGRPAYADYGVDPNAGLPVDGVDFQGAVDNCMKGFAAAGGDPAGILNRLKDKKTPKVRIIPTTGGSGAFETPDSPDGQGSSTVTWNPTSVEKYTDGVSRDPCAALYHELNHADDISKNSVPAGDCGDTGIKTAEVKATLAENRYRQSKGLPVRTEYLGKKLPKSLDDCKKPKKKEPDKGPKKMCEGASTNECGSTNGDPHLVTLDRAYYDFQAVGEFVVVRSTAGDALEVQARQSPLGDSRRASANTAVAFRLGGHRVTLTIINAATQVSLDGAVVTLPEGEKKLPDGGTLLRRESDISGADGYDLTWPDGSAAAVDQIGSYGYRLLIRLATSRAGKVQGLLGNFDGDPSNDIAPPTGAALTQPVTFEALYPSYADSWRITQTTSLFTYADGQSTETFTDRSYPTAPMTVADLDAARRAQAEAVCRWAGITDAWQFAECVFDVGVSGRPEFATSGAATELIAPPAAAPIAAKPIASGTITAGPLPAGATNRLTFAGHAGDAVFVDISAPTMPSECSPYRLLDPAGKDIGSGCHINGVGYIDRTELATDGQYTVLIDARAGVTGRASIRVYASRDTVGTLEPNGAAVSAVVEQPGSLVRYRFTGAAGTRVFLDVPQSDLPSQCSPLELRDPAGKMMTSGCVINGSGEIEGTVLPADGTYTVTVDPRDRTIGTIHMRLFAARDEIRTIAANGQPVVATIGQPGVVNAFRFTATAGMSVTLAATEATLPNQCSPLELRGPGGTVVASGCVINGVGGIDTTVLPGAGEYTVVVDPSGSATGTVTLSLRT